MTARGDLVGRDAELERLTQRFDRARAGDGGILLLSGEAGVGKTRLTAELAARVPDALVLSATASQSGTAPYGPVVGVLRAGLREDADALAGCGALVPHLAVLLPELGEPAAASDPPTLFEAIRCLLAGLVRDRAGLVILDDLQWSDEATLELLSALVHHLPELSLLVVAAYRSDGLPRDHGLRRFRHELRRAGQLDELALGPLGEKEVAELLESVLDAAPASSLVRSVNNATQGSPFFVEELAAALRVSDALSKGRHGVELARHGEVPLPDTVRDAVLIAASDLSERGRAAAETAAVAGEVFDLDLVSALASPQGVAEMLESGLTREGDMGSAAFRHGLAREALYADIPWLRRRALHRAIATALETAGASSREVATHWLGARELTKARDSLLLAARESEELFAFRDAAESARKALDLWAEGEDDERRLEALERYARCSELSGDLAESARAWRELADLRTGVECAEARRRLAAVLELRGERTSAFAVRRLAAEGFATCGAPADAAAELLAMANQTRISAKHADAVVLSVRARAEAERAGRLDLRLRAQGLEGMARAKGGDYEAGVETVRAALAVALEHDMTVVAADLYQRLSVALYDGVELREAQDALATALDLCQVAGDPGVESACVTCLAYVLRERGEWKESAEVCRDLVRNETAVWVAEGLLGAIHGFQGRYSSARRLLTSCLATASQVRHYNMTIDSTGALARVAAAEGAHDEARERCRVLLTEWEQSNDHHYAISGLRWAASFYAGLGDARSVRECADALGQMASGAGHPDALAALACAIGESAMLDGDRATAAEQIVRAAELHRDLDVPFERAQIELRAGMALAAAGERELALERFTGAHRLARKLGARPLATEAAREVSALGESVEARLGSRAAADADSAGLSRRELEVVRLLSVGRTNREIAQELFLSRRTVDMHVRNILRKLDCRTRVEAAHRAGELGLLVA
jgi:DNA-binding NarL/FixJ family response regulator